MNWPMLILAYFGASIVFTVFACLLLKGGYRDEDE